MSLKDKLIKTAFGKLTSEIEKYKSFLKKPNVLLTLETVALSLVNASISQLKKNIEGNLSDEEIIDLVKKDRDIQKLWGIIGRDTEETYINEILLICENPDYYSHDLDNFLKSLGNRDLSSEDYINIFNNSDEFDRKTANYKTSSELSNAIGKIVEITPWALMICAIAIKVREFLKQSEYPSPFRGKYLQRLIRSVSSALKQRTQNEKQTIQRDSGRKKSISDNEKARIKSILKNLKSLDSIITGSLLASLIYLKNRKSLQKDAIKSFNEIHSEQLCMNIEEVQIPEIISSFSEDLNSCPIDLDDNIVPHVPIEEANLSCEIPLNKEGEIKEGSKSDIAAKALYQNTSSINLNILVKKGDGIRIDAPMATYNGDKVYPTVNGIVEKIEENKIYVQNISDPDQTYIEKIITNLNTSYKELNDTKFFLSDFYISSMYPVMLKYSPLIDGSLSVQESLSLIYLIGGVKKRWKHMEDLFEKQKKDWDKRNQEIAKDSKVKAKAEVEKMDDIRIEMNQSEEIFFKQIKSDAKLGINQSKITKPLESEFELIEFYFSLLKNLMDYFDKNDVSNTFIDKISEFLRERYFIDKYNADKIKNKINDYCRDLAWGNYYFPSTPNFYEILKTKWEESNAEIGKRFVAAENYLKDLEKKNKKLSDNQKKSLREYILFLFNFSMEINNLEEIKYSTEETKWERTEIEGNWIEKFFNSLWKRYEEIPKEIEGIQKELDNIARTFSTYSIIEINGEQYRYYSIGEVNCEPPDEEDPYLSPKSKKGYGDISYWLRYCSFATLASVANPATGWSTGVPPPVGPILFPTVYIPIKAFEVNWGFIVVGLTITGIYPFPWALFVNWSTEHHVPLADPVTLIKKEVEALKKEISNQLKQFKKEKLKSYLDKAKKDIQYLKDRLADFQEQKRSLREKKPRRDYSVDKKKDLIRYAKDLFVWNEKIVSLDEIILSTKKDKLQLEVKYKIIKEAYDGAPMRKNSDAKIQSLKKTEEKITSQFDKLDSLISGMENFLAPLPISTKPETANFAFTVKNPKPIIKMASDIDQNINYGPLDKINKKFEPKNEDLMKTDYSSALSKTFNNFKGYKSALKTSMPLIVKSDPFPKYENLKPSNLPWMTFLFKEWTPTGAKTYGFPGFNPIPV